MKICSCGFTEFQVKVDNEDNEFILICCVKCNTTYYPNEMLGLLDTDDTDNETEKTD